MQSNLRPELQQKSSLRSADDILEAAPKHSRTIRLDANVVAAFGDLFEQLRSIGALSTSAHTVQPSTASSQSQS
jgi:hypothetical protein